MTYPANIDNSVPDINMLFKVGLYSDERFVFIRLNLGLHVK